MCAGVGRVRSNRNTSLVLGCLGRNGICSIAIVYKFKQLCIAVRVLPDTDIGVAFTIFFYTGLSLFSGHAVIFDKAVTQGRTDENLQLF